MNFTSLRDRLSVPVEWIATRIAGRPKAALIAWILSLALLAWMF